MKATTREARVRHAGYRLITTPRPRGRCSPHPTTTKASAPAKTGFLALRWPHFSGPSWRQRMFEEESGLLACAGPHRGQLEPELKSQASGANWRRRNRARPRRESQKTTANTHGRLVNCSRMFGTTPSATAVLAAITIVPPPSRDSASPPQVPEPSHPPTRRSECALLGAHCVRSRSAGRASMPAGGRFLTAPTRCPRQPDRRQARDSTSP